MNCAAVRQNERGASLIELTFILPIFLLVLVGLVDIGLSLRNIEALGDLAKDNARYAASKDTTCVGLHARTEQRVLASLQDAGFSPEKWRPELAFIYPGELPLSANPLNLTMIRVAIINHSPCTICIERLLKLSTIRAQAVFALEPRSVGSKNNPSKKQCEREEILEPL